MAKQKERNEVEFLRSENKNLKSENRNLKKQLSRSNKRAYQYEDLEEKIKDIESEKDYKPIFDDKNKCPKCRAKLEKIELGARILFRCSSCTFRETKKS